MNNLVEQYLDKMLEMEGKGYLDAALELNDKLIQTFPEEKETILLEKAKMKFRSGYEKEALMDFITVYSISGNVEVYQLILDAYFIPNKEEMLEQFFFNMELLKEYPHYRNENKQEEVSIFPIWQDDEILVYVDIKLRKFGIYQEDSIENSLESGQIVMLVNELWIDKILLYEKSCRLKEHFMGQDHPMYLLYDGTYWILLNQLYNLKQLIEKKRIVFLVDEQGCRNYLYNSWAFFPQVIIFNNKSQYKDKLMLDNIERVKEDYKKSFNNMKQYYERNKEEIIKRVNRGNPKILFLTSRFTTALQYHTRDCMQAAKRLGCEVELAMEPDNIQRNVMAYMIRISEFKPDIIFMISHLRLEFSFFPAESVCISWVQDPSPAIMKKESPMKLTSRDILMNHFTTWKDFREIGYDERHLIDAPIPANSHIYKPYHLTDMEYERYKCDICFVCHKSDVDEHISELTEYMPEFFKKTCQAVYKGYQEYVYETGTIFFEKENLTRFVEGAFRQNYNVMLTDLQLDHLVNDIYMRFNYIMFKQVLVDWLIDAGITNIKLWGNGWTTSDKYKKYAMGPAENGETLSKIYQASKIVVGNNCMSTANARVWESMLSGAFYMSNYIPPETDMVDIRKIVKVDEEVVMFYDRDDFLQKVRFYLSHEEERQKMIQVGRKVALERMTYDSLMKRVLEEVPKKLEQLKEWKE